MRIKVVFRKWTLRPWNESSRCPYWQPWRSQLSHCPVQPSPMWNVISLVIVGTKTESFICGIVFRNNEVTPTCHARQTSVVSVPDPLTFRFILLSNLPGDLQAATFLFTKQVVASVCKMLVRQNASLLKQLAKRLKGRKGERDWLRNIVVLSRSGPPTYVVGEST